MVWHVVKLSRSTRAGAGKPFGYRASTPEEFAEYVIRGATLTPVGGDLQFIQEMGLDYAKRSKASLRAGEGVNKLGEPWRLCRFDLRNGSAFPRGAEPFFFFTFHFLPRMPERLTSCEIFENSA
jgi:hypothetical protein